MPKQLLEAPEIVVVDYDAGNLRSVQRAMEHVGLRPLVTPNPRDVERAEALVLPGVGSAQDCMRKLRERGLVEPLQAYARSGRPFLGVCVGLQLLFDASEEGGGVPCLGILPGVVKRFENHPKLKVPQIGWNQVSITRPHPLLEDIPDSTFFYFVHSYYVDATPGLTVGATDYGVEFAAIVARDNVVATQFHPEKSADRGLQIYANFGRIAAQSLVYANSGG